MTTRIKIVILLLLVGMLQATSLRGQTLSPVDSRLTWMGPFSVNIVDNLKTSIPKVRLMLLMRDMTAMNPRVKLRLHVEGFNNRIYTSKYANTRIIDLTPGMPLFLQGMDLYEYFLPENLDFVGVNKNNYVQNFQLPEDRYTIWFEVVEATTLTRVSSNEQYAMAWFILNDPPELVSPANEKKLYIDQSPTLLFQWIASHRGSMNASFLSEYKIDIVEIPPSYTGSIPAAFMALSPKISEISRTNSFLYNNVMHAPLLPGYKYAYRVQVYQAGAMDEMRLFKNNGYSEIRWFEVSESCPSVGIPSANAVSSRAIEVTYMDNPKYEEVTVYRKKKMTEQDTKDYTWYKYKGTSSPITVPELVPLVTYEYKVEAQCQFEKSEISVIKEITMPEDPPPLVQCGVVGEKMVQTSDEPLRELKVNDMVLLRPDGWKFRISEVSTSHGDGIFSGKGYLRMQMLRGAWILMRFTNLRLNVDYQQMYHEGCDIVSIEDVWEKGIKSGDAYFEGGGVGSVVTGLTETATKTTLTLSDNSTAQYDMNTGMLTITTEAGQSAVVQTDGLPTTITDGRGGIYEVNERGKVTQIAAPAASGTTGTPSNTISPTNRVSFAAHSAQRYAFDEFDSKYGSSQLISKVYEKQGDYYISYKCIPHGKSDKVLARVNGDIDSDKLVFKTSKDVVYKHTKISDNEYELTLASGKENDAQEVFAMYQRDSASSWQTLGKLRVVTYQTKRPEVVIVPVNNADINESKLKELSGVVNSIYNPIDVGFTFTLADRFENTDWDLNNNGYLDVEGSGLLATLTDEMNALNAAYLQSIGEPKAKTVYLFLLPNAPQNRDGISIAGDMPRDKRFGYLFPASSAEILGNTIAHELGHGLFNLKHIFDRDYGINQNTTDNLMDYTYTGGTKLIFYQWNQIHDPGHVWGMFEKDGDAMIKTHLIYLTPSGTPFRVKDSIENLTYISTSAIENNTKLNYVVYAFKAKGEKYSADIREETFYGYVNESGQKYEIITDYTANQTITVTLYNYLYNTCQCELITAEYTVPTATNAILQTTPSFVEKSKRILNIPNCSTIVPALNESLFEIRTIAQHENNIIAFSTGLMMKIMESGTAAYYFYTYGDENKDVVYKWNENAWNKVILQSPPVFSSWEYLKLGFEVCKEILSNPNVTLDAIGMTPIPVVSNLADVSSGVIYYVRGDNVSGSLSMVSAIPLVGVAAGTIKIAKNSIREGKLYTHSLEYVAECQKHLETLLQGSLRNVDDYNRFYVKLQILGTALKGLSDNGTMLIAKNVDANEFRGIIENLSALNSEKQQLFFEAITTSSNEATHISKHLSDLKAEHIIDFDKLDNIAQSRWINEFADAWHLSKQKLGLAADSKVLGENLEAVGKVRPDNSAAHHIVAGGSNNANAIAARQLLKDADIDINEAANGVFLPKNSKYVIDDASPHQNIHTKDYYEAVSKVFFDKPFG